MGMSQEQLGRAVDLTFQQVQKYERGANRISASRLYDFCRILHVPISFFFQDLSGDAASPVSGEPVETNMSREADLIMRRETIELVRAYFQIQDQDMRLKIRELIVSLADESAEG